jgi:hypothetical protein
MPSNDYSPNFMLCSEFDARPFTGTLYTRKNGSNSTINVSLPTTSQIVFDDIIAFLNGGALQASTSLESALNIIYTGEAGWDVNINSSDKIYWNRLNNASTTVALYPNSTSQASSIYGIIPGVYSDGKITTNDWKRGMITVDANDRFYLDSGSFKVAILPHVPFIQDLPSYLRQRSGSGLYCLESIEHGSFYISGAVPPVLWVLDSEGHVMQVVYALASNNSHLKEFAWVDTEFRDRLGFSGNEQWTAVSGWNYWWVMRADYTAPGVLCPSRPLNDNHYTFERVSNPKKLLDGSMSSNYLGNFVSSNISFYLDALSDIKNDLPSYVFNDYFYEGSRVSLYQNWETRTALIPSKTNVNQPAYTNTSTSEMDGLYGVVTGYIESLTNDLPYPEMIRRRIPITMSIRHDK